MPHCFRWSVNQHTKWFYLYGWIINTSYRCYYQIMKLVKGQLQELFSPWCNNQCFTWGKHFSPFPLCDTGVLVLSGLHPQLLAFGICDLTMFVNLKIRWSPLLWTSCVNFLLLLVILLILLFIWTFILVYLRLKQK